MMNKLAFEAIQQAMCWEELPAAVQARLAGWAKGVWSRAVPTTDPLALGSQLDACQAPAITITKSQRKVMVNYEGTSIHARSHRILCLLRPAKASTSVTLNQQILLCLWWGMKKQADRQNRDYSLPLKVFKDIIQDGLTTTLWPFTHMNDPDYLPLLWHAVERAGGLTATRMRHLLVGHSRAQGWGQKFGKDEEDEDTPEGFDRNPHSGSPASIYMTVLEMLWNGFHPSSSPRLHNEILAIMKMVTERFLKEYHLPVAKAVEAIMIPGVCPSTFACVSY
jgi:RNA-dependent RNA polymerase